MASEEQKDIQTAKVGAQEQPKLKLNTENLKSSYCNFCNANSTREEVVLNFGINSSWDRGLPEIEVELLHRVVLSPFATKQLSGILANLTKEYEARYGELN